MRGSNEFWLSYHQLIEAYKAEGATTDARSANIVNQFRGLPSSVRLHIVEDLDEFLSVMAEVRVAVRSDADGSFSGRPR